MSSPPAPPYWPPTGNRWEIMTPTMVPPPPPPRQLPSGGSDDRSRLDLPPAMDPSVLLTILNLGVDPRDHITPDTNTGSNPAWLDWTWLNDIGEKEGNHHEGQLFETGCFAVTEPLDSDDEGIQLLDWAETACDEHDADPAWLEWQDMTRLKRERLLEEQPTTTGIPTCSPPPRPRPADDIDILNPRLRSRHVAKQNKTRTTVETLRLRTLKELLADRAFAARAATPTRSRIVPKPPSEMTAACSGRSGYTRRSYSRQTLLAIQEQISPSNTNVDIETLVSHFHGLGRTKTP